MDDVTPGARLHKVPTGLPPSLHHEILNVSLEVLWHHLGITPISRLGMLLSWYFNEADVDIHWRQEINPSTMNNNNVYVI